MKLDSHQHFWIYNDIDYVWMSQEHSPIRRDFTPDDLRPILRAAGFDGSITVQARQTLEETRWLLGLAQSFDFIKGVVGWVDLCSPDVSRQLDGLCGNPKLKGVRHVIHDEPDDRFMLREDFRRGLGLLRARNLTYDLLIFPKHIPYAVELASSIPDQPFVVDHIAKPDIKGKKLSPWKEDIMTLSKLENVWCKVSGMVTEACWGKWIKDDFRPYLDSIFDAFGVDRLMIGSDWPVCTLSGSYEDVVGIVFDYISDLSTDERQKVLGGNCAKFYGIDG